MRVVADTNIYISALNFGGLPERFLRLAEDGDIELAISLPILNEVEKVLRGRKFGWPEEAIVWVRLHIERITARVEPISTLRVIEADPSDNRILECAEAIGADYIVSGDAKHVLPLGHHGKTPIVTLADFFRVMRGNR